MGCFERNVPHNSGGVNTTGARRIVEKELKVDDEFERGNRPNSGNKSTLEDQKRESEIRGGRKVEK